MGCARKDFWFYESGPRSGPHPTSMEMCLPAAPRGRWPCRLTTEYRNQARPRQVFFVRLADRRAPACESLVLLFRG